MSQPPADQSIGRTIRDKIADPNRPTWEQYKQDNRDKLFENADTDRQMEEYRQQLDRDRERRLKRRSSDSDGSDSGNRKRKKKKHKSKTTKHHKKRSRRDDSSSLDEDSRKHKKSKKKKRKTEKHDSDSSVEAHKLSNFFDNNRPERHHHS